jgi:hypothetical protein
VKVRDPVSTAAEHDDCGDRPQDKKIGMAALLWMILLLVTWTPSKVTDRQREKITVVPREM